MEMLNIHGAIPSADRKGWRINPRLECGAERRHKTCHRGFQRCPSRYVAPGSVWPVRAGGLCGRVTRGPSGAVSTASHPFPTPLAHLPSALLRNLRLSIASQPT